MSDKQKLLEIKNLTKVFGHGREQVVAVNDVSFNVDRNEIVSFVGQSGSGKTTVARMLLGLLPPSSGNILYRNYDITNYSRREKRIYWRDVQGIFQDPYASFNQFFRVEKILEDCFSLYDEDISTGEKMDRIINALKAVNLSPEDVLGKYPFEMSGGQRQRIMIARTFLIEPRILIADEPTSMIDACSRASILDVLLRVKEEKKTSIIFITHDMGFAYYASDRIYIMENGRIVERGSVEDVVNNPQHPYTISLLNDVPKLHQSWI